MPMYGTSYVFSKPFFRFWVALTFIWGFAAAFVITLLPLWEGRHTLAMFWNFITGKRGKDVTHTEGFAVTEQRTASSSTEKASGGEAKEVDV
jgi:urea-proton symporter